MHGHTGTHLCNQDFCLNYLAVEAYTFVPPSVFTHGMTFVPLPTGNLTVPHVAPTLAYLPPEPPVQDTGGRNVPIPRPMHGTSVGTDNDEDINHGPDYDPLGICEEEFES